jgi:hypothetical protein
MAEITASQVGFDTLSDKTRDRESDELSGSLIRDWQYMSGLRGNWESHWSEIAERIYPMHANLFQAFSQNQSKGDKRNQEVFDSTGVISLQRFGAILDSLLTPRNQFWHQLRPDDDTLLKDKATRLWFEDTNQKLFQYRYLASANFASQNQLQYKSLGAYGTGGLLIDDLAGQKGLRYRNVHLSELYLSENHQGVVDRVCRRFTMTARQAMQKFGHRCPESIQKAFETFPEREYVFLHWVRPNENQDSFRKDWRGMEFSSYYMSVQEGKIVAEGGYRTFPYSISRYEQAPTEAYGRSPAMDVLPSIKTLNEQKKTMLKQGHRVTDPVLLAHDDGVIDGFSMEPGSINPGGVSKDGRLLVQPLPVGNVQAGHEMMLEEQALIKDTFLVSIFQILSENPEMTATEVMERTREKGILLAPTIGRQQSEYLGPLIDRELDILSRQGVLQPQPKMLKSAKGKYKIVYDSPITRAQKAERVSGALRTMEAFGQYAQLSQNPAVLDTINMDVAAPQIADAYGVPPTWLNTPEDIAKIRQARAQQQAQQTAIQAAPAAAAMMKTQAAAGKGQG